MVHKRTDLEDTFDINDDEQEDNQLRETEYHHLLPSTTVASSPSVSGSSYVQQQSTDGVFSNMAAKPESNAKVEEVPPVSFGEKWECSWLNKNLIELFA